MTPLKDDHYTPSTIVRTNSFLTMESSDSDCDSSDLQPAVMKNGSRSSDATTATATSSRSTGSIWDMSDEELQTVGASYLPSQPLSALKVKTQEESLQLCIDDYSDSSRHHLTVVFGDLQIREYARRPGCNPGCRIGVSLEIEWEPQDEVTVSLEDYEATRPARRDRGELNIPSEIRMQMLRDSGFTRGEILQYVKLANVTRGHRARTNETLQLAGAEELVQKLMRGLRNKTTRRSAKKKERDSLRLSLIQDQKLMQLRRSFNTSASPEKDVAWKREPSCKPSQPEDEEVFAMPHVEIEC